MENQPRLKNFNLNITFTRNVNRLSPPQRLPMDIPTKI